MTEISSFIPGSEVGEPHAFESGRRVLADGAGDPNFSAIRTDPVFVAARRELGRFIVAALVAFLSWYMAYVLLAAYAQDLMATRIFGNVTLGLLFGLSQFVSTVVIMLWYTRFARRRIDPEIAKLRHRVGQ